MSAAVACGGDDDGGGGSTQVDTGLPASQKFSELDEDEARQACDGLASTFNALLSEDEAKRVACTAAAIGGSITEAGKGDVAGCKQMVTECMAGDDIGQEDVELDFGPGEDGCDDVELNEDIMSCDATVGEFERCVSGLAGAFKSRLTGLSCDALKDLEKLEDMLDASVEPADVPQCETFKKKCSEIELF